MERFANPAGSPLTWCLALMFVLLIDAGITRTRLLWGPSEFERTGDPNRYVFAQTYRVARALYDSRPSSSQRVILLGNSRVLLIAPASGVSRELARASGLKDVSVDNLGVFGARIGEIEVLSRHLHRAAPTLVVLTMSGSDLLSPIEAIEHETARFLNVGWRDGPNGDSSLSERLERWARTVWPLFRFRELARAALVDRVREGGFAVEDSTPPGELATPRAYFDFVHGPRGAQVDAKYRAWRADRTFASYLAFMTARDPEYLRGVRNRVRNYIPLDEESPTRRSLDALLGRLAGGRFRSTIVLMPENPVLELDRQGLYHDTELEDRAVAILLREAERFGIPVVDGRRWKPAEDFSDFDHLMIGVAGFETLLAREIARALAG